MNDENKIDKNDNPVISTDENQTPKFERSFSGRYEVNVGGGNNNDSPKSVNNTESFGFSIRRSVDLKAYLINKRSMLIGAAVGFPLCAFFICNTIFYLLIEVILTYIYGPVTARVYLSDPYVSILISSCLSLFVFTVPYLYTVKLTKSRLSDMVSFKKVDSNRMMALVMLGIGFCTVANFFTTMFSRLYELVFDEKIVPVQSEVGEGLGSYFLSLLCVGILPAVLEEFALRGIILSALRKHFGDGSSIVISAVLFGLLHGNLRQIPFAFCVGLILAFTVVCSGSLLPAVIIHAFNNISSVTLDFSLRGMTPTESTVLFYLFYAVTLMIGICGFILLIKVDKNALRFSKERCENTKVKLLWFCLSIWIIVFVALCVYQVLSIQGII